MGGLEGLAGHTSRNEFQVSSWAAAGEETTWRAPRVALVPSEPPAAGLLLLLRGVPSDGAEPSTAASDKCSSESVSTARSMLGSVLSHMLFIAPRASLPPTSSMSTPIGAKGDQRATRTPSRAYWSLPSAPLSVSEGCGVWGEGRGVRG